MSAIKLLFLWLKQSSFVSLCLFFSILSTTLLFDPGVKASGLSKQYSVQSLLIGGLMLKRVLEAPSISNEIYDEYLNNQLEQANDFSSTYQAMAEPTPFYGNCTSTSYAKQCPETETGADNSKSIKDTQSSSLVTSDMCCLIHPIKNSSGKPDGQGDEPRGMICEHCKTNIAEPGFRYCFRCAARQPSESATEEYPCSACSQVGGGRLDKGRWICRNCDHGKKGAVCLVYCNPANCENGSLFRPACEHEYLAHKGCLGEGTLRCSVCTKSDHFVGSQGKSLQTVRCVPQERTIATLLAELTTAEYLGYCDELLSQLLIQFEGTVTQQELINFLRDNEQIPVDEVLFKVAKHLLPPGVVEATMQQRQLEQQQPPQKVAPVHPLDVPLRPPPAQSRRQNLNCNIL